MDGLPHRRAEIVAVPARLAAFTRGIPFRTCWTGPFEQFCENALARNDALAANACAWLRENNARSGGVGGGRFHTDGPTVACPTRGVGGRGDAAF